ncbi:hypothetical protein OC835_005049 [Tilletia horrida]|nr:hypothetical protein OC835_005049 [Tilletia horrida]
MAPSAMDLLAPRTVIASGPEYLAGPFNIKVSGTQKFIGRADFETADFAPKPIIVREEPYEWFIEPKKSASANEPLYYNLIAGGAAAGHWTAEGNKVSSFVAPVEGQEAASKLQLQHVGGSIEKGFTYYIKQANESVAGKPKSGAWYVDSVDELAPVLAGTRGRASTFRFVSLARPSPIDIHLGPVKVDIV